MFTGFPTPDPSPLTKLNTPLGTPTLSKFLQNNCANGVSSDGFKTTGLPAANAAANLSEVWFVGKFRVTSPATQLLFNNQIIATLFSNWKLSKASLAAVK